MWVLALTDTQVTIIVASLSPLAAVGIYVAERRAARKRWVQEQEAAHQRWLREQRFPVYVKFYAACLDAMRKLAEWSAQAENRSLYTEQDDVPQTVFQVWDQLHDALFDGASEVSLVGSGDTALAADVAAKALDYWMAVLLSKHATHPQMVEALEAMEIFRRGAQDALDVPSS